MKTIKKNQSEMNNTTETKNVFYGVNSRLDETDLISNLKSQVAENTQSEQQEEKKELEKMKTV